MTLTTLRPDGTQNTTGGQVCHKHVSNAALSAIDRHQLSIDHGGFSIHRAHLPAYDAMKQFT